MPQPSARLTRHYFCQKQRDVVLADSHQGGLQQAVDEYCRFLADMKASEGSQSFVSKGPSVVAGSLYQAIGVEEDDIARFNRVPDVLVCGASKWPEKQPVLSELNKFVRAALPQPARL